MTNELQPTHVVDGWDHIFHGGNQRVVRLYLDRNEDGWQLVAARFLGAGGELGLLTRSQFADLLESFEQHAATDYPFDAEARPANEADRREMR